MTSMPPMPFRYDDDPEPSDNVPSAQELGQVPDAECTVLSGDRVTFMGEEWGDPMGVTQAWLTTDRENVVHVEDYA